MKKMFDNKIVKGFIVTVKSIFILSIVLYIAFTVVQKLTGNKSIFGYRLFTVVTGSMQGVYDINDVIAVRDYDVDSLNVGDDIAYKGDKGAVKGLIVTHRIIKIEDTENGRIFFTKGVNSKYQDPVVSEKQVLGIVVGVVPIISMINHIVRTQIGFFSLVFCPLVLLIVVEVLQTITDYQLEKNELRERKLNSNEIL